MAGTKNVKSLSVDLAVMTPDRLTKIIFGLDKATNVETVDWTIEFQFMQRATKTDQFGDPLVKLNIEVKKANQALAEETAIKGLNSRQTDHLLGPAMVAAKRLKEGTTTNEKAAATIERTLAKRNA